MNSWDEIIDEERNKEYFISLKKEIDKRYLTTTVFPPKDLIFNAFSKTPFKDLKIVVLGQDPYHGKGQAQDSLFYTKRD